MTSLAGRLSARARRLPAFVVLLCLGTLAVGPSPLASGQAVLAGQAAQLRSAVAAENARLDSTRDGLAQAQRRLTSLVARARVREARLADAQTRLLQSRIHLARLQRREATAQRVLAANLRAQYEGGQPQLVSVILASTRFADLYQRLDFYKRLSKRNANILDVTKDARADVTTQTKDLQGLWSRYSVLARAAVADREQADTLRTALLVRERTQLAHRNAASSRVAVVRTRIARLERARAAAARRAASVSTATTQAPATIRSAGGGGGDAVARVVAAANQI